MTINWHMSICGRREVVGQTHLQQVLQKRDTVCPLLDIIERAEAFLNQLAKSFEFGVCGV
jgi:hypothetical protein